MTYSFLLLLFYLCACNNSNTGTVKQNEAHAVPEVKAIFINGGSIHYIFVGGVIGDSSFFSKMPLQGRETMMDNTLELRERGLH